MYELERGRKQEEKERRKERGGFFAHNAIEKESRPGNGLIVADNSRPMQQQQQGHFFAASR